MKNSSGRQVESCHLPVYDEGHFCCLFKSVGNTELKNSSLLPSGRLIARGRSFVSLITWLK